MKYNFASVSIVLILILGMFNMKHKKTYGTSLQQIEVLKVDNIQKNKTPFQELLSEINLNDSKYFKDFKNEWLNSNKYYEGSQIVVEDDLNIYNFNTLDCFDSCCLPPPPKKRNIVQLTEHGILACDEIIPLADLDLFLLNNYSNNGYDNDLSQHPRKIIFYTNYEDNTSTQLIKDHFIHLAKSIDFVKENLDYPIQLNLKIEIPYFLKGYKNEI